MKIAATRVTSFTVTEVPDLDPIHIYFEDIQPGVGRVVLTCWGKAWTAFWSGIADADVASFFSRMSVDYLMGYLKGDIEVEKELDLVALEKIGCERIAELLSFGRLPADTAEQYTEELSEGACNLEDESGLLEALFGSEYWREVPMTYSSDYRYLERIVRAARDALRFHLDSETVPA